MSFSSKHYYLILVEFVDREFFSRVCHSDLKQLSHHVLNLKQVSQMNR